jgi:hypothetical protein
MTSDEKTPKIMWVRFYLLLPISLLVFAVMVPLWGVQCVIETLEILYNRFYAIRRHFILTGKFIRP